MRDVLYLDPNRVQQSFGYTANPWYFPDWQLSHKPPNNFRVKLKVKLSIWLVLEGRLCERSSTVLRGNSSPCLSRSGSTRGDVIHGTRIVLDDYTFASICDATRVSAVVDHPERSIPCSERSLR